MAPRVNSKLKGKNTILYTNSCRASSFDFPDIFRNLVTFEFHILVDIERHQV